MLDILEKNGVFIAVTLGILVLAIFFGGPFIIDKVADKVIEKLQKYSPGPYGPGIDPDKVDPKLLNKQTIFNQEPQRVPFKEETSDWNKKWEESRH